MRDERLEVDAALRDEVDSELVVPRLVTQGCVENGDQSGVRRMRKEKRTYAVTERALEVDLLHEERRDWDLDLRGTHPDLQYTTGQITRTPSQRSDRKAREARKARARPIRTWTYRPPCFAM